MEIKLTIPNAFSTNFSGYGAFLCGANLRNKVSMPRGVQTIYAIFTKTNPNEDAFTIREPTNAGFGLDKSGTKEWRGSLTYETARLLARKYKIGYRYVNIDYEVPV